MSISGAKPGPQWPGFFLAAAPVVWEASGGAGPFAGLVLEDEGVEEGAGHPVSWGVQAQHLVAVGSFLSWCTRQHLVPYNAAQELELPRQLGHAELSTTALYTRVSVACLKAVHTRAHPARLTCAPAPAPYLAADLVASPLTTDDGLDS